jgi:hypothetical protein
MEKIYEVGEKLTCEVNLKQWLYVPPEIYCIEDLVDKDFTTLEE